MWLTGGVLVSHVTDAEIFEVGVILGKILIDVTGVKTLFTREKRTSPGRPENHHSAKYFEAHQFRCDMNYFQWSLVKQL